MSTHLPLILGSGVGVGICTRSAEFRQSDDDSNDGRNLTGYAAVFDQDTEIHSWEGDFIETLSKGAFKKTLRERKGKIQMQYDHGRDIRVGTVPIGFYRALEEDDHGLLVDGRLHDNDVVEPVRQAIESGAIQGMSFKFRVLRDEWRDKKGKLVKPDQLLDLLWGGDPERTPLRRTIKEVQLFEAGPVSTPAYDGTSVGVRSAEELDIEDRSKIVAGYTKTMLVEEDRSGEPDEREEQEPPAPEETSEPDDAARTGTSQQSETPEPTPPPEGTSDRATQETKHITRKVIPMTLAELLARAAELRATLESLNTEFDGAEIPEARQAEWDDADKDLRSTLGKIEAIQARQARVKELAERGSVETTTPAPARSERYGDGPAVTRTESNPFDLDAVRKASHGEEDFAVRVSSAARKAAETMRFSAAAGGKDKALARVSELLDQDTEDSVLAQRIMLTGSPLYERAFSKALRACNLYGLSNEEARVMTLGVDADGGYAVPVQLDPTVILTNDGHIGDMRRLARVETIVGKEWQGITSDGISVSRDGDPGAGEIGRAPELHEASDASFTLDNPKIRVTRVQGFVPFSIEIDQDWNGLRSEITRMLADAKAREENESFVLGDGTGLQPLGVVGGLTAAEEYDAGATFGSEDIYGIETDLAPRWRANAKWLGDKSTYNLVRQFADADGHDLWERIGGGLPPRLLGYEVHENSYVPTLGSTALTSYRILVFGDFQQFLIVDRVGMSVELVPHVFGPNGRPTGQRGVYAIWRNNAKILVPNAFRALTVTTA